MGLARAAGLSVILVGDIDRGGLFASLYGTLALLSAEDQALVCGFLVNKFRGDEGVLAPGLQELSRITNRPLLGTLPFVAGFGVLRGGFLALAARGGAEPRREGGEEPAAREGCGAGRGRAPRQDQQLY